MDGVQVNEVWYNMVQIAWDSLLFDFWNFSKVWNFEILASLEVLVILVIW